MFYGDFRTTSSLWYGLCFIHEMFKGMPDVSYPYRCVSIISCFLVKFSGLILGMFYFSSFIVPRRVPFLTPCVGYSIYSCSFEIVFGKEWFRLFSQSLFASLLCLLVHSPLFRCGWVCMSVSLICLYVV